MLNPTLEEQNDTEYLNSPEVTAKFKAMAGAISELDALSRRAIQSNEDVDSETDEACLKLEKLFNEALKVVNERQGVIDVKTFLECVPPERLIQALMQYFTYRMNPVFNFLHGKRFLEQMNKVKETISKKASESLDAKLIRAAANSKAPLN